MADLTWDLLPLGGFDQFKCGDLSSFLEQSEEFEMLEADSGIPYVRQVFRTQFGVDLNEPSVSNKLHGVKILQKRSSIALEEACQATSEAKLDITDEYKLNSNELSKWACSPVDNVRVRPHENPLGQTRVTTMTATEALSGTLSEACSVTSDPVHEPFWQAMDDFSPLRAFLLVTDRCDDCTPGLEALTNIGWLYIFDFDQLSLNTGLHAAISSPMKANKNIVLSTPHDPHKSIFLGDTHWCLLRGYSRLPDTLINGSVKEWNKQAGKSIYNQLEDLAGVLSSNKAVTLLVLMYDEGDSLQFIEKLIQRVTDSNLPEPKVVLCHSPNSKQAGTTRFAQMCKDHEISVFPMMLDSLCDVIKSKMPIPCSQSMPSRFSLPREESTLDVDSETVSWLKLIKVLYLNESFEDEDGNEDGGYFFRGGVIQWKHLILETMDTRRTMQDDLLEEIRKWVKYRKRVFLEVFHAPGGGGTTLGRRALFDLHKLKECTCVWILELSSSNLGEVCHRIKWIYNNTHLPVVGMADGEDQVLMKRLLTLCMDVRLVLVSLRRSISVMSENRLKCKQHWLHSELDKQEATKFAHTFTARCSPTKAKAIHQLEEEVKRGKRHEVFEFGLAAYEEEYAGLRSYVEGYLQRIEEGNYWQQVLAYLAVAWYYGQTHIPCQFFAKLCGVSEKETVTFASGNLPRRAQQFIVQEDGRWRISHYMVAKEILEQYLCRGNTHVRNRKNRLSEEASKRLGELACAFIKECKGQCKQTTSNSADILVKILTSIFIRRDTIETGHEEDSNPHSRRPLLSRIMTDIRREEQLGVLESLTSSFPNEPNYHAHLGRFWGIIDAWNDGGIVHFQRAIELETKRMSKADMAGSGFSTTYHMYGILLSRRVSDLVGGTLYDMSTRRKGTALECSETNLTRIINVVREACEQFLESRNNNPGSNESYGYIGEITVRLQVAEFVRLRYKSSHQNGYFGYLSEGKSAENVDFLLSCCTQCDQLLRECEEILYQDYEVSRTSSPQDITHLVNMFNHVFNCQVPLLPADTLKNRRIKVLLLILKHNSNFNTVATVDNIADKDDILQVIDLLQRTLNEAFLQNLEININQDMRSLLRAIRHEKVGTMYSVREVMQWVERWYQQSNYHSLDAINYLYILHTISAIGSPKHPGSMMSMSRCLELREEIHRILEQKQASRIYRATEFLGKEMDSGIQRLVHRSELGEWHQEDFFFKDIAKHKRLDICTGTVRPDKRDRRHKYYISLDSHTELGPNVKPISVYFDPDRQPRQFRASQHQRVQFYIGFSILRGCEAFFVHALERFHCSKCGEKEMPTLGNALSMYCKCGVLMRKTSL